MALARWKDLCIDATDPGVLGRFWGAVLDLEIETQDNGDLVMRAAGEPGRTIWVNGVPEPKTAKHRVHPDIRIELDTVLDLGATVLRAPDDEVHWHVLADPEGGEFCVFEPAPDPAGTFYELVVATADPAAQSAWWADVLGGIARKQEDKPWRWVEDVPDLPFPFLVFTPVPEPKSVKNRWHWDVVCDDVDGLVAKGAAVLRKPDAEISWHVMTDPEGNEFCVFASS